MKIALGRLGWTEDEFYNSTLRAFLLAIRAKDAADRYKENNLAWLFRMHAYFVAMGYAGDKIKNPSELWPHPWDENPQVEQPTTLEDIERMREIFAKWDEMN